MSSWNIHESQNDENGNNICLLANGGGHFNQARKYTFLLFVDRSSKFSPFAPLSVLQCRYHWQWKGKSWRGKGLTAPRSKAHHKKKKSSSSFGKDRSTI